MRQKTSLLLFSILLLGLLLRVYKITSHDLGISEFYSLRYANDLKTMFVAEVHPPLYFTLLKGWISVFGRSILSMRFLSLLFSWLNIIAIYLLAKKIFGEPTALISAFILSISPMHIYYAQEIRHYCLQPLLITGLAYFVFAAIKTNKIKYWIGLVSFLVLSLCTDYNAFFVFVPILFFTLLSANHNHLVKKRMLWALSLAIIFYIPCLPLFWDQLIHIKQNLSQEPPAVKTIFATFDIFNLGYNASPLSYKIADFISCVLLFFAIFIRKDERKGALFCVLFIFLPWLTVFAFSHIAVSIYLVRQLIILTPFYYILLARGINGLKPELFKKGVVVILTITCLFPLYNYYNDRYFVSYTWLRIYKKNAIKPAVDFLTDNLREGDIIVHSNMLSSLLFKYYLSNRPIVTKESFFVIPELNGEYPNLMRRMVNHKVSASDVDYKIVLPAYFNGMHFNRLWLIAYDWPLDYGLEPHSIEVIKEMNSSYTKINGQWVGTIWIGLYTQKK
jgi:mannosyltransferase